jgi:hypothetical protein
MSEQLQRTKENWTYGIINIPLLYGHNNKHGVNPKTIIKKVAHNAKCYNKPYPALDKSKRYLWFELDTLDGQAQDSILRYFEFMHTDVYYHRTMKGYHYITMQLYPLEQYEDIVNSLKEKFDNGTFYYSLRIIPNKWINEMGVWYNGYIINNGSGHIKQLQYIQHAINQPYIFNYNRTIPKTVEMLQNIFCISRYEFKGALQV